MDKGVQTRAWKSVEGVELLRIARRGNCPFHPTGRVTPRWIQSAQMKGKNT